MELTAQRFSQALFVLEQGLLDEVVNTAKSRTVSGLLTSVILEQGRLEGQSRDEGGYPGGSRRS
jgi:hypothetical protein